MEYRPRIIESILRLDLEAMGAVLIEGAKATGKTTCGEQLAESVVFIDNPSLFPQYEFMSQTNISQLLNGESPRLIDEWQLIPRIWDAVRYEVDHNKESRFILTGSSVPPDYEKEKIRHSGAGRFAWLKMRPMTLWETGVSTGAVSLGSLFEGKHDIEGLNPLQLKDIASECCIGGWPGVLGKSDEVASRYISNYLDAIVKSDISRVDHTSRDEYRARMIVRSLSRNQGTQASLSVIRDDVKNHDSMYISEKTISDYIDALRKIFIVEDMQAWNPSLKSKTAIRQADTRYFVDPSVACAALNIGPGELMNDLKSFGLIFETLCIRDLRVYSQSIYGTVQHYRDKTGLECDAVIHLSNGKYGLVEIKLGGDKLIEDGSANLNKLESRLDEEKMGHPAFKMILTAVGPYAYRRPDGVLVVPVGTLRP